MKKTNQLILLAVAWVLCFGTPDISAIGVPDWIANIVRIGSPSPFPAAGFRSLIVYEQEELSKLPPSQLTVLNSTAVRGYLNSKCVKGPDGKTPEWRVLDRHADTKHESELWQEMLAKPCPSLPWLYVGDRNGESVALPATEAETLAILKKYGGE